VKIEASGGAKLDAMAKVHDGRLYVFAVNYDERALVAEATITVAGLTPNRKIEVVDEERTIQAGAGSFSDKFEPLAVHVYRIEGVN
jgi:hypothetical protein